MASHLSPVVHDCASIRNILFDFGGVLCDIDIPITHARFMAFGPPKEAINPAQEEAGQAFGRLVEQLETGAITPAEFRQSIRNYYRQPLTDEMINDAWNALLLEIPEPRIRLLENIRGQYRIFLLSNSNQIHYDCFVKRFREQFGYADFDALFEKAWFSFRMGMKKPNKEIYSFVLQQHSLVPGETLFIDDTLLNVESAVNLGIKGYHLKPGEEIAHLFV